MKMATRLPRIPMTVKMIGFSITAKVRSAAVGFFDVRGGTTVFLDIGFPLAGRPDLCISRRNILR
jgi:hypothetical protein